MIIAGLDVGTTGCKTALYEETGSGFVFLDGLYKEYDVVRENGRHEIDFGVVREGVFGLLREAFKKYPVDALGVTGFGEAFVMLDEEDRILAPSMLYTDPRGEKELEMLCGAVGAERLTRLTGTKPHTMYSIAKMAWMKNNKPELFGRCRRILLSEDFIVYSLTGIARIDYTLAARTAAFDIEKKKWIWEVFDAAGIPEKLMSKPAPTGSAAGVLSEKAKALIGTERDTLVVCGAHDQAAAMIGSGVFLPGQAMDGTGTVECMPVVLKNRPEDISFYDGGYSVVPYMNGLYACYALSFTGGATLKWFRDNFAELECKKAREENKNVYAELDKAVGDDPTGILVLPHFAGAATPYMDSSAKAAFVGVTLETTKLDLYKALMEGTSYEMLVNFNTLKALTGRITRIMATGGGASSDVWLQIKADVLDSEITALSCREAGAAGTAALAGAALGMSVSVGDAVRMMAPERKVFSPDKNKVKIYSSLYKKYEKLYNAVKGLEEK
ncbi:MAG: carbohydrate kinase [Clostridia bacterium]|nr:carbohydrate kinase [Clostridia bacterium]